MNFDSFSGMDYAVIAIVVLVIWTLIAGIKTDTGGTGEIGRQRGFGGGPAEHPRAGAGNRNADAIGKPGHEHPDNGITRRRVAELGIAGGERQLEPHPRDDFAIGERGGEHALEIIIGGVAGAVGLGDAIERQDRRRIVRRRIIVGEHPADGAAIANLLVAAEAGERRQPRDGASAGSGLDAPHGSHHQRRNCP